MEDEVAFQLVQHWPGGDEGIMGDLGWRSQSTLPYQRGLTVVIW